MVTPLLDGSVKPLSEQIVKKILKLQLGNSVNQIQDIQLNNTLNQR